jgi:hypothetical protein
VHRRSGRQTDRLHNLMNTFHLPTRRIHRGYEASLHHPAPIPPARKYRSGVEARQLLALAAVCAAIFAGSFAVAHQGSTPSSPREAGPWAVPVVSAGSPILVHLSPAPTIEIEAPVVAPRPQRVHAPTGQAVARAPLAEARTVSPALPTSPPPAAPVAPQAPAPTPREQAPSPPEQAPPSAPPASSHGSSGSAPASSTPPPEAGKSFDTSG